MGRQKGLPFAFCSNQVRILRLPQEGNIVFKTQWFSLCALAVAIGAHSAQAEEAGDYYANHAHYASHATVASMSRQIAELEARLASFDHGGCDAGCDAGCGAAATSCGGGADCCDNWMSPTSGLTGMIEVVWLRPQDTYADSGINRYQHGSRYTLGWMNDHGQEWRLRFFELGVNSQFDDFINLYTVDVEYAGRFQLCNFDGELSFGLRYADWHESAAGAFGGLNIEDSIGPMIGLHLQTDLWNDFDLFANARYSHQFGHPVDSTLGSFSITELSVGLQYARDMACGTAFLRGAFEAQNWAVNTDGSDEDMGFVGFGVALGFTR